MHEQTVARQVLLKVAPELLVDLFRLPESMKVVDTYCTCVVGENPVVYFVIEGPNLPEVLEGELPPIADVRMGVENYRVLDSMKVDGREIVKRERV